MKRIGYLLLVSIFFISCNRESIKIKGEIEGLADGSLIIKMRTNKKIREKCLDTVQISGSKFKYKSDLIKPPVKLTAWVNDTCEFDIHVGMYGSIQIHGSLQELKRIQIENDDLSREYWAYYNRLDLAYIQPIRAKIKWINDKNDLSRKGVEPSSEDKLLMEKYHKDILKAFSKRRMSIVKTARKNPTSKVMMAIIQKEYKKLNKRHKAEMKKLFGKRYSDTAMYWQMCP